MDDLQYANSSQLQVATFDIVMKNTDRQIHITHGNANEKKLTVNQA